MTRPFSLRSLRIERSRCDKWENWRLHKFIEKLQIDTQKLTIFYRLRRLGV